MDELSIVIVTWNSADVIERCLSSLDQFRPGCDHTVTVVDNASQDATADLVSAKFPQFQLIRNEENRGFAAANNRALESTAGRYILLLNPDSEVRDDSIDRLVDFMNQHDHAWVAGPALVNSDGTRQHYGVRFLNIWNMLVEAFYFDKLFPRSRIFGRHKEMFLEQDAPRRVDFVQGAAFMVRRDAVNAVGLLDEGFFMYFEEADWCYRMGQSGGETWLIPTSRISHHGGTDPGHYDETRLIHYHRSLLRFLRKHYGFLCRTAARFVVLLRTLVRFVSWSLVLTLRPGMRQAAKSSLRGYLGVFRILLLGG
ncbi:MAG: glycosyltransferase family 2 protein [Bacteroidota bacterium]